MRRCIYTGLASLLLLAATTNGRAQEDPERKTSAEQQTGLSEDQRVHHFLNRFTLGATPALMAEVKQKGMRKWLEEQLKGDRPEPESLKQALGKLPSLDMTLGEIADEYVLELEPDATPQQRRQARQLAQLPAKELLDSVMLRGALCNNQLREVSSDFFRNHFAVSLEKGPVELMAVNWERTVI